MRDIQSEIIAGLDKIEKENNVTILLAIESGSRAWGFASPDSDYDVRFIYARKMEDYLAIQPGRDVIEWQLDDVLDINGWDITKALLAFGKGNANVFEWAKSPIIYRKHECWDKVAETAFNYFSEKASLCHYYGTANSTCKSFLSGEQIRYKKYFYALRPLLCCRYIEHYHKIPPMEFKDLLPLFDLGLPGLDSSLFEAIQYLLEQKKVTEEKDLNPQIPEIIGFIESECLRQKEISDSLPDDHNKDFSDLDKAFRYVIGSLKQ